MAADDDSAHPDASADNAPRKKRWWKRLPPSDVYPPRRARLLVLPGEVEMLTIREAADWLARVAAEEADPEQRQTLRGKYRFMYGHALCELIRSGDFQLVKPHTVSRETFEHFARWYGYHLNCDPDESLPQESGVIVPEGRTQAFGLGEPGTRRLYLPAGAKVVELFAVPELLARAVNNDAPPEMHDDTALLAETFERRLRDELSAGRIVTLCWDSRDSREPMPGSSAWAVLTKAAVITRAHLEQFAALCGVPVLDFPAGDDAQAMSATANDGAKPVQRQAAQEARILEEIRKLGYDPLALPPNPRGKAGVKAEVRAICERDQSLFPPGKKGKKSKTFDLAWERLSAAKSIKYRKQQCPSPGIPQTEG
ncbi:hypothetical protein AWB68_05005 [Caballeronia choica]|uniref:Uncharacterized protein n=1 Tax=Caballeronia choica TaxID=326476 RepID=A0A158K7K5_9BURK|nr:hypothetical protein [Caballeronia choica]SAL76530.1 hypothetical protein AWB68_05005 [Caballeronia choica]